MKNVELIRQRVVRGQSNELMRLRSFISMADSTNVEAIAALQGESLEELLGVITELVMARLGHVNVVVGKEANATSRALRAAAKILKSPRGQKAGEDDKAAQGE